VLPDGLEHQTSSILPVGVNQLRIPVAQLPGNFTSRVSDGVNRGDRDIFVVNASALGLSDHKAATADDLAVTTKPLDSRSQIQSHTVYRPGFEVF
jgi:hypothetical protein